MSPAAATASGGSTSVWTPRRCELRDWLRANAPSVAPAFEGAVEILGQADLPGRIHFIGHAVRDIADRLVFALDPELDGQRIPYEDHLDRIVPDWPPVTEAYEASDRPAPDEISVPYAVAREVDDLVRSHRDRRKRPSQYELLFEWLSKQDPSQATVSPRIVNTFKKTRAWFMRRTHVPAKPPRPYDEKELHRQFESFESTLHSFVGSFFTGTEELDEILRQANQ